MGCIFRIRLTNLLKGPDDLRDPGEVVEHEAGVGKLLSRRQADRLTGAGRQQLKLKLSGDQLPNVTGSSPGRLPLGGAAAERVAQLEVDVGQVSTEVLLLRFRVHHRTDLQNGVGVSGTGF